MHSMRTQARRFGRDEAGCCQAGLLRYTNGVRMAPKPTFRAIEDSDREFLRTLFFSSWDRAIALADWPDETKQLVLNQQFEAQDSSYRMERPDASYELILLAGEPVGRLYVHRAGESIDLMDITLLPAYRNGGLGTAIMKDLFAEASVADKPVELYVEKWNPQARRLYLRLGFTDTEDIGSHWKLAWTSPDA